VSKEQSKKRGVAPRTRTANTVPLSGASCAFMSVVYRCRSAFIPETDMARCHVDLAHTPLRRGWRLKGAGDEGGTLK
jgi:hypothetical protein